MTTINLKDFYYWYTQDQFIEVSDEVAEVFVADARHEMAYQRRLSRHKAQYSLDCDDGIEYSACLHEPTPQELLERMELFIRLWNALNSLPEIQGRRIDAHIILGKSIKEIAEAEGVHEESVRQSIKRGLGQATATIRHRTGWPPVSPAALLSARERRSEYGCLWTGQENGSGVP
mgnify:CR=1 FL=1